MVRLETARPRARAAEAAATPRRSISADVEVETASISPAKQAKDREEREGERNGCLMCVAIWRTPHKTKKVKIDFDFKWLEFFI